MHTIDRPFAMSAPSSAVGAAGAPAPDSTAPVAPAPIALATIALVGLVLLAPAPAFAQAGGAPDPAAPDAASVDSLGDSTDPGLPTGAIEVIDMAAQEESPPGLDDAELARSRECVPVLSRLQSLSAELSPLRQRAQRIQELHRAATLEDSTRAAPLDVSDPLERRVSEWFREDLALARQYLETEEEAVREERRAQRDALLDELETAFDELDGEIEAIIESTGNLGEMIPRCEGRILVRSAVIEACGADQSSVCQAARAEPGTGSLQFVEAPADLWDIEQLRPWTDPTRIRPAPEGGLAGARTFSVTRRGNAYLSVSLEPLIQPRSAVSPEQARRFDANLDSLGVVFDHPDFVMSPALAFELDLPDTLGGETHYLLHFGDLSDPANDVIRSIPVPGGWPAGGAFSPREATLVRLARGEPVSMTAVRMTEGGEEADVIFSLGLTQVLQVEMVTAVLQYLADGTLSADLSALVPPGSLEGPGNGDGARNGDGAGNGNGAGGAGVGGDGN